MALAGRLLGSSCAFKRSALQKRQFLVRAQDFRFTCFKASLADHRLRDLRINPRDPEASVRVTLRDVPCSAATVTVAHGCAVDLRSLRCPLLTLSRHLTDDIYLRKKYITLYWSRGPASQIQHVPIYYRWLSYRF